MKQQVLYQKTDTLRLTVYDRNRALVPSSGTIVLYKNDGNIPLQASTSVTISSAGEMTYSLTTTHTSILGLNFKAVWTYVVSGTTYYETQLFDVVRSVLSIPITDEDIYGEIPSLRKKNAQATGTATSATSSSLVDTARRKEDDDYWKGGIVEILAGTGAGQVRDITGFTQSSATVAVSPTWTTTPSTDSTYRIVKSWSNIIQTCFEKVEQMLYDKGKRDALILEASQIKFPLLFLVIQTIAIDLRDEENDKWDLIQKDYLAKFKDSFNTLALDYDDDESGGVQGQEQQQSISSLRIFRS